MNYDELLERVSEIAVNKHGRLNKSTIKRVLDNLDSDIYSEVYKKDSWILEEDMTDVGKLCAISKKRIERLIEQDLLSNNAA